MNGIDTGELIRETEIIATIEIDVTVIGGKMITQEENAMKGMKNTAIQTAVEDIVVVAQTLQGIRRK